MELSTSHYWIPPLSILGMTRWEFEVGQQNAFLFYKKLVQSDEGWSNAQGYKKNNVPENWPIYYDIGRC